MLPSSHRLLQLLLATSFAAWCSAVHGFALPSTARVAIAPHHGAVLKQCIERVTATVDIDGECELDEAPPTQQRFHAPDLLGLDDQPEDEDLGSAPAAVTVYGPREVEHGVWSDRLSPVRDPHTQLDRPPRA